MLIMLFLIMILILKNEIAERNERIANELEDTLNQLLEEVKSQTDQSQLANYAQWERKEDVEAMFKVPDPKEYTKQILQISSQNWGAYKVVYTSTNS